MRENDCERTTCGLDPFAHPINESTGTQGSTKRFSPVINTTSFRVAVQSRQQIHPEICKKNSHKPDDLWHLVTPDYRKANIWVQLNSGDNKDMERVIE